MDLSIVIPCYNEVENTPKLRDELFPVVVELAQTRSVEVIFVDDGSTDGTWPSLTDTFGHWRKPGLTVQFERHAVNRGVGAALRTGLTAARGEIVVTTDSDGTYKFSTIPALLAYLKDDVDIVTASPYDPKGGVVGVPAYRLILSQGSSTIYRLIVDWRVRTYTCLFRAYRRKVIERVSFASDGYLAGTELLVKAMLMGCRVAEYPAVLYSRALGVSKVKIVRTILAHLGFQGRVILHWLHLLSLVDRQGPGGGREWRQSRLASTGENRK